MGMWLTNKIRVLYIPCPRRTSAEIVNLVAWMCGMLGVEWTMSAVVNDPLPSNSEAEVTQQYLKGKLEANLMGKMDALLSHGLQARQRDLRTLDEADKKKSMEEKKKVKDEAEAAMEAQREFDKQTEKLKKELADKGNAEDDADEAELEDQRREQERALKASERARELQSLDVWDRDATGTPLASSSGQRSRAPPARLQVDPGSPTPKPRAPRTTKGRQAKPVIDDP
jgi:hypothetical protein